MLWTLRAEQLAGGTIDWNGVSSRFHAAEADAAILVGEEFAAQVHVGLDRILVFIKAFRRRMPDIDLGADDRLALRIPEREMGEQRRAGRWGTHDRVAILGHWRLHPPERAQHVLVGLCCSPISIVEQADQ